MKDLEEVVAFDFSQSHATQDINSESNMTKTFAADACLGTMRALFQETENVEVGTTVLRLGRDLAAIIYLAVESDTCFSFFRN